MHKNSLCFLIISLLLCFPSFCYGQEDEVVQDKSVCIDRQFDFSNLLIHQDSLTGFHSYQYIDGTKFSYWAVNKILKNLEVNRPLLKKTKFWEIMTYVSIGVGVGTVCGVPHFTDNEDIHTLSIAGGIVCFCSMVMFSHFRDSYQSRAVDNYNLYILQLDNENPD